MFIHYGINLFLINLQDQVPTVTAEGAGNVGEGDWIEIKTEEDCAQLAATIKTEPEVSVLCWCVLWCRFIYKCVCVLYCTLCLVTHTSYVHITPFQFLPVTQLMYLCDTFRLIAVCPNYYLFPSPTPHNQLPFCLWQSVLLLCKGRWRGCRGNVGNSWECQNGLCLLQCSK
jgi:hypothetical protein